MKIACLFAIVLAVAAQDGDGSQAQSSQAQGAQAQGAQSQGAQSQGTQSQGYGQAQDSSQSQGYAAPAAVEPAYAPAMAMAAPVAGPVVAPVAGEDMGYATCLVCFGAVILIGIIATSFLDWRFAACEISEGCKKENNPCKANRGCMSFNREGSGLNAGSKSPHDGIDAKLVATHGCGLSKKHASKIIQAVGSSSSLL